MPVWNCPRNVGNFTTGHKPPYHEVGQFTRKRTYCVPCRLQQVMECEANHNRTMRKVRGNLQRTSLLFQGYWNSFSILNSVANPIKAKMPAAMEWTNFIGILAANLLPIRTAGTSANSIPNVVPAMTISGVP